MDKFMEGFSITYSAHEQRRFLELLDAGDLEKAIEKLEGMPHGVKPTDDAQRLIVKLEGYKIIVGRFRSGLSELDKKVLERYKAMGETDVLRERLKMLDAYIEVGTAEEFRELKDVSRRLQEL